MLKLSLISRVTAYGEGPASRYDSVSQLYSRTEREVESLLGEPYWQSTRNLHELMRVYHKAGVSLTLIENRVPHPEEVSTLVAEDFRIVLSCPTTTGIEHIANQLATYMVPVLGDGPNPNVDLICGITGEPLGL